MKEKNSKKFEAATGSQYFQGIIQLRNPNEEVISFIKSELMENIHKGVFVSREKKVRNGLDIYVSSNKFAINLGNKLFKNFGGLMKINEKLFSRSRQTSKDLYRVTVLYKPLEFLKGDILKSNRNIIKITHIGKKISGVNLATGKTELIDYKKNKDIGKLEVFKTTVSKIYPELEVIHPETFQSVAVLNPKKLQIGEKVKVVLQDGVWLVV